MLNLFPTARQLDMMDCGPACLKIISRFYGKSFSLQYIRDRCSTTKEGVSLYDISHAADMLGFKTLAFKCPLDALREKVSLPCILHWNENHFVVLYKVGKRHVSISDPMKGLVRYSIADFMEHWLHRGASKGIVLAIEPQPAFYEILHTDRKVGKQTLWSLLGYLRPYRKNFWMLFVAMLIGVMLQALLPFISRAIVDTGVRTHDIAFINLVLIGNIIVLVGVSISNSLRDWILMHITSRVNISLVSDYIAKIMRLPISFFESRLVGDLLQRASDHDRVRGFIMKNSLNLIFSFITFLVFSIILLSFHKDIFFILMGGSIVYAIWVLAFFNIRKKMDWHGHDLTARNQSYWIETIEGIQDIKINNHEHARRWKWEELQAKLYHLSMRQTSFTNTEAIGSQFIDNLKNVLITFYCARGVVNGEITFGEMVSTQFIIGMLNGPVGQFINFIIGAQYASISFARINEVHLMQNEETNTNTNSFELPGDRSIRLENVSFTYSPHVPPVLKGIRMHIPEGKITAIVGDSGSGKSTLLKLLLRLYKPSFGEIQIGNMNMSNISIRNWRDKCGAVMQDGKIFNDTILSNIVLDINNVDFKRLREVVQIANISEEIERMPLGYNTLMGESGRGLSGGQKQRLLIARALYKNPDYLFLDEATNSLDSINEAKITKALEHLYVGKTVVVVAHRLSTIRNADQIIVMNKGQVVEVGDHETLLRRNGRYAQLIKSQLESSIIPA